MVYDGPIKCALILEDTRKPENVKVELEHEDGNPVSKNELESIVDLGREPWPYKYGIDGGIIDKFYWGFKNNTKDIAKKYHQQRVSATTFRTIGFLIPKKFQYIKSLNVTPHFLDEFTSDLSVFHDKASILAQAYLFNPRNKKGFNGLTQWNDNFFFTPYGDSLPAYLVDSVHFTEGEKNSNGELKTLATQPMLEINMHEKRHNFGGHHDENSPDSIAYPYVKPGYKINRKFFPDGTSTKGEINPSSFIWSDEDIEWWQAPYGARIFAGWKLAYFRARRLNGYFEPGTPYRLTK